MEELKTLLSGGADGALIIIAIMLLKLERRVMRLELQFYRAAGKEEKNKVGSGW